MSSSFIGSKIAIITKSQYRYVGTIIGIDAQASSILLGNVKCFGTENRAGSFSNNQMVGTVVPIMQFANSDIEDLKIVDDESAVENPPTSIPLQQPSTFAMSILSSPPLPPPPPAPKQPSIHDDPAIVSAVVSTSSKDLTTSSRLVNDLQHLKLTDDPLKTEESRLRSVSGDLGPSWPLVSPSKWDTNKSSSQQQQQPQATSNNKSKFFDDFSLNSTEQSQQRWPSTTQTNQFLHSSKDQNIESTLPVRQPFFSNDRSHSQQQNRHQNGYAQKHFYNNRRNQSNHQHRRFGDSNRETFNDNGNSYEDEFDFESNNRKFNKITNEDEYKDPAESSNQLINMKQDLVEAANDFQPIYDKKKSFFDNISHEDTSNASGPMYNRSRNHDTFGVNDRNQRQKYHGGNLGGSGGGFRRTNYNNHRQQQRNDDFYYRQNNNGYHYRN